MRIDFKAGAVSFFIALIIGSAVFGMPRSLASLDSLIYDIMTRANAKPADPFPAIIIVDIDEESLRREGQWPWSRNKLAKIIGTIAKGGPASITIDVIFPESDRLSPNTYVEEHLSDLTIDAAEITSLASYDTVFAQAISEAPVVLSHANLLDVPTGMKLPDLLERRPTINILAKEQSRLVDGLPTGLFKLSGLLPNIPELDAAASGVGIVTLPNDHDGVSRAVPTIFQFEDKIMPSLALETLRVALGARGQVARLGDMGLGDIVVQGRRGSIVVETDPQGRIWLNYPSLPEGKDRYFDVVSASDVLRSGFNHNIFQNRIVLIGASATGLFDLKTTPLGENERLPGVDLHALAIMQALTGAMIKTKDVTVYQILASFVFLLFITFVYPLLDIRVSLAFLLLLLISVAAGQYWLFSTKDTYASMLKFFVFVSGLGLFRVVIDFIRRDSQRREIKSAFSQYLSPALVDKISHSPSLLKLGGEMKELTILFADIRGFTTVSEDLKDDPERLTAIVNDILTPLTDIIQAQGGTIDKYIGDCIMAFWNAPLNDEDHAAAAVRAATEMVEAMPNINSDLQKRHQYSGFKIGLGLNTGEVVVGNLGSRTRFDYSVLGDAVNLAARLESISKTYPGVDIVVGEATKSKCISETSELVFIDELQVKGKQEAVKVYWPVKDISESVLTEHRKIMQSYQSDPFEKAEQTISFAVEHADERLRGLYGLMLNRRRDLYHAGDSEWKGVWRAVEK